MDATTLGFVSAGVALASGLISASVNSWLNTKSKVNEELRALRLKAYPAVWLKTSLFSRWPWTDATRDDLEDFHLDLRAWYYRDGGICLSTNGRKRYGEMQEVCEAHLCTGSSAPGAELEPTAYDDMLNVCSAFRSAMTEDLESRRQSSLYWTVARAFEHRSQKRDARHRLSKLTTPKPETRRRYPLSQVGATTLQQ